MEEIEIPECPICGNSHIYKLKVDRAHVFHMVTPDVLRERPQPKRVTRIFTCPMKNEEFETTFTLHHTSSDRINSVDVEGLIEDEER